MSKSELLLRAPDNPELGTVRQRDLQNVSFWLFRVNISFDGDKLFADQVHGSVRAATDACPGCRYHSALRKPRGQLVAIPQIRLPPTKHGAIHGNDKRGIPVRVGSSNEPGEHLSVLLFQRSSNRGAMLNGRQRTKGVGGGREVNCQLE